MNDGPPVYQPFFSEDFTRVLKRLVKKNTSLYDRLNEQVKKIIRNPLCGKPLRNILRNRRRIHIGSFVLIYEIKHWEVKFLDFDHHDRVYKK